VSPDRTKIAVSHRWALSFPAPPPATHDAAVALFDFDPITGIVSNSVTLLPYGTGAFAFDSTAYSVCFSSDGSKLYYTDGNYGSPKIYQFDLSSGNPAIMANSRTYLGTAGINASNVLRRGPDGKILFLGIVDTFGDIALGTIGAPNLSGKACQFFHDTIPLAAGMTKNSLEGTNFPNVVNELKIGTTRTLHHILECTGDSILLTATDTSGWSYAWGDNTAILNYNRYVYISDSSYSLTYYTATEQPSCVYHSDSFGVTFTHLAQPVISVRGRGLILGTIAPYDAYQWYLNGNVLPGATNRYDTIGENGQYTVVVWDTATGCTDTSEVYNATGVGIDNISYLKYAIKIYPNPFSTLIHIQTPVALDAEITDMTGRVIIRQLNTNMIKVKNLAAGVYFIRLYDLTGGAVKVVKLVKNKK